MDLLPFFAFQIESKPQYVEFSTDSNFKKLFCNAGISAISYQDSVSNEIRVVINGTFCYIHMFEISP